MILEIPFAIILNSWWHWPYIALSTFHSRSAKGQLLFITQMTRLSLAKGNHNSVHHQYTCWIWMAYRSSSIASDGTIMDAWALETSVQLYLNSSWNVTYWRSLRPWWVAHEFCREFGKIDFDWPLSLIHPMAWWQCQSHWYCICCRKSQWGVHKIHIWCCPLLLAISTHFLFLVVTTPLWYDWPMEATWNNHLYN